MSANAAPKCTKAMHILPGSLRNRGAHLPRPLTPHSVVVEPQKDVEQFAALFVPRGEQVVAQPGDLPTERERTWWICTQRARKLYKARSRLYRSQILQGNTLWKALAEIYTMHSFAPFWNRIPKTRKTTVLYLNFFVKIC